MITRSTLSPGAPSLGSSRPTRNDPVQRPAPSKRRPRGARWWYSLGALLVASALFTSLAIMALVPLFPQILEPVVRFACPDGHIYQAPTHGMIRGTFGSSNQIYCFLSDGSLQNHSLQASIYAWIAVSAIVFLSLLILSGARGSLKRDSLERAARDALEQPSRRTGPLNFGSKKRRV